MIVVAILVLVAFVASFLWAGATFQGRRRTTAIVAVLVFWIGAYWWEGGGREKVRYRWEADARGVCVENIGNALESTDVDGLLDEQTLLTPDSVLHLFLQNNLRFIEIRVGRSANRNDAMSFGDGYNWRRSETEKLYAKLDLSQKGDAKCITLPKGSAGRESSVPFLPDTCVRASFSDKPTARYSLEFTPAKYSDWPFLSRYGAWSIIDKHRNETLATAATDLQKPYPIELKRPDELLRYDPSVYYSDGRSCVAGSGLLSRVRSIRNSDPGNNRFLVPKRLSIQDPTSVLDDAETPVIQPKKLFKEYAKPTDNAHDYERAWGDAEARAQKNSWSNYRYYYGDYLIHWGSREIIGLEMQSSSREYSWRVYAIEDGFVLLSYPLLFNAKTDHGSRMLRYTSDGELVWSARVAPPPERVGRCQTIEPKWVSIDGDELILGTHCASNERGLEVREVWSIPLSSLPCSIS